MRKHRANSKVASDIYHRKETRGRRERRLLKAAAIAAYGGKCECCGEANQDMLTIDHISGNGRQHREATNNHTYRWLQKHGYPKKEFRLLCFSCNWSRRMNRGLCSHMLTKGNGESCKKK